MRPFIRFILCASLLTGVMSAAAEAQVYGVRSHDDSVLAPADSSLTSVLDDAIVAAPSVGFTAGQADVDGASNCESCAAAGSFECCCNDWRCREHLFGDWHGRRSCLAQRGIIADLQLTQFYQGVSSGGSDRIFKYGGKVDYTFTFLGEPLGLWKGFTTILHAETRFGRDINTDAGALAFPNTNMLYPLPGAHNTAITGLLFMQQLNETYSLAAGKINALDLWQMLYPHTGRGIDGFMNFSMIAFPTFLRTTNLSFNGAGMMRMQGPQIQGAVFVYDTNNSSTTAGLSNLFDQGAVILGYWRFFTDYGGRPGSHGFIGNWSSRTYASTDPTTWTIIPGQGLSAGQVTGSWGLAYILDQTLWADCCNADRNLRLFSQWSLVDGDPSPYRWSFNVALQGQGLVCGREADTMGVGYFYDELGAGFKQLVSANPNFDIQNVHGAELYYNAAITPWFHLTADLQIVDNQNIADDTAIILGLRANIDF